MVFSDLAFIFFLLPVFIIIDFLLRRHCSARNLVLIAISLIFYSYDGSGSLIILIAYGILNYLYSMLLSRSSQQDTNTKRKLILALGIAGNLAGLCYYKYAFWLISLLPWNVHLGSAPNLPLGISFFTFHAISYLVDLYSGRIASRPTVLQFLTYFFMFPHLVAGPIVRFEHVAQELRTRTYSSAQFSYGMWRFILGINKKVLIANSVAPIADFTFKLNLDALSSSDLILGALAYTLQIYFDFSAYSDMAIGLAAMAGFKFHENFNAPYQADSIRNLWQRWHISLSTWLKNYVYIPLGGSRVKTGKIYRNLLIVFVLCGLWHGANATFLIWGLYHGAFLILERTAFGSFLAKWPSLLKRTYVFIVVLFGWIFFRAESLDQAVAYICAMLNFSRDGHFFDLTIGLYNYAALIIGLLIALYTPQAFKAIPSQDGRIAQSSYALNAVLLFLSIAVLYLGSRNPFIYFNF